MYQKRYREYSLTSQKARKPGIRDKIYTETCCMFHLTIFQNVFTVISIKKVRCTCNWWPLQEIRWFIWV